VFATAVLVPASARTAHFSPSLLRQWFRGYACRGREPTVGPALVLEAVASATRTAITVLVMAARLPGKTTLAWTYLGQRRGRNVASLAATGVVRERCDGARAAVLDSNQ